MDWEMINILLNFEWSMGNESSARPEKKKTAKAQPKPAPGHKRENFKPAATRIADVASWLPVYGVAGATEAATIEGMEDPANIQDVYVVSFPLSPSELEWLKQQSLRVAEEFKRFRARQIESVDAAGNDPPK
jgi:hypothetical protein